MALDDFQRIPFAQKTPVMQTQYDVRNDFQICGNQVFQRTFKILHLTAQVVHLGDCVLRANHIHHGCVYAAIFHTPRDIHVHQGSVHRDFERGESVFDAADGCVIGVILHLVAMIGATGKQHALGTAANLLVHHAPQLFRCARRDHGFQNFCFAMVTLQLAVPARNRNRWPSALAATANFRGSIGFKGGGIKIDAICPAAFQCGEPLLHIRNQTGVQFKPVQRFNLLDHF